MLKRVLRVAALGFMPLCLNAQTASNEDVAEIYINLDQVVVTGTGTHRRMSNSPVPIQVLTAKDLENASVTSVQEALTKLSPNITTVTNGMGTFLNMNGIGQDYLIILENGHRIGGDERLSRISAGNIKRIEIQNGAASALYGSEAIGGVINIITNESKEGIDVNSYTNISTHGRFTQSTDANASYGKLSSTSSFQRQEADNWQVNDIDEQGYKTGRPMSTAFTQNNFTQSLAYAINDRLTVKVRGNFNDYATRRPQTATYFKKSSKKDADGNYIYNETQAYTYDMAHQTWLAGANARYYLDKASYIDADIYSDNYTSEFNYFSKNGSFQRGDSQTRKQTHYYDANLKSVYKFSDRSKMTVGTEFINEQLRSESDNISFESMYTAAVYGQEELNITDNFQSVIGVRYIYNENFHSHVTPNLALMYKLGNLNLRASASQGFRSPTLSQIYATDETKTQSRFTVGNRNLKPETSTFYSINAEYSVSRFSFSVTALKNNVKDMINYKVLSDSEISALGYDELHNEFATIRQRANIDKAYVNSLNINTNIYIGAGLTIGGGYVFTDSKASTTETDGTVTESPVDKSVRNSGSVNVRWDHTWGNYHLNVDLNGHIQGERYSSTYGYAPKYSQFDLHTHHTFYLDEYTVEPGIGVENIFNERDERPWNSNFSTVNPGRSVYASLTIKFRK